MCIVPSIINMKNNVSLLLVVAVILSGVFLAFAPAPSPKTTPLAATKTVAVKGE